MLVDTGSDRTIVSAGVVRGAKLDAANKVPVLCVHTPSSPLLLSWTESVSLQPTPVQPPPLLPHCRHPSQGEL